MLTNPVVVSVAVMTVLCLFRLNVILSLVVAAIVGGAMAGMPLGEAMSVLVGGMGGNAENALSYILLGTMAAVIAKTQATDVLVQKISKVIKTNKTALLIIMALIACLSGTLVPVHIAFIPILIPPLLLLMNKLKLDRRAMACSLAFGLKAPYITIPVGYGLIFHNIIRDNMKLSGMEISTGMVWQATWIAGLAMLLGLLIALFIYRKPREYDHPEDLSFGVAHTEGEAKMEGKHWVVLLACVAALAAQLTYSSMAMGAMTGLAVMIVFRAVKWGELEDCVKEGIKFMGMIAIIIMLGSGYAAVMRETGGVASLVESAKTIMEGSKLMAASMMILVGLIITMGIGTSFGTVPVVAAIYCPLCSALGFSVPATILLIAVAAALGDAGSPASDTTLGPTAGLNVDGQHDHIWDTCVPTFLCYNIPLALFGIVGAVLL